VSFAARFWIALVEGGSPKVESRNPKEGRNPKSEPELLDFPGDPVFAPR